MKTPTQFAQAVSARLIALEMAPRDAQAWANAARNAAEQGPMGTVRILVDAAMVLALAKALERMPSAPAPAPAPVLPDPFDTLGPAPTIDLSELRAAPLLSPVADPFAAEPLGPPPVVEIF